MTTEVMKQVLDLLTFQREVAPPLDEDVDKCITALRQAISQPDCRGCKNYPRSSIPCEAAYYGDCTNGDKFQALPKVVLYKVTK